jgi:predicted PurR-regulated permease PerM
MPRLQVSLREALPAALQRRTVRCEHPQGCSCGGEDDMTSDGDAGFAGRAVDAAIKIGLVALLAVWCLEIVRPFMLPLIWGAIIAIASYPGYVSLERRLGGRSRLAAILWTIVGLILVLGPIGTLAGVLVENVHSLAGKLRAEGLHVPAPPDAIATWPLVGEPAHRFWALASTNLGAALAQIETQIRALSALLLTAIASAGLGMLQLVIAVIIAGVLLPQAEGGARAANAVATRLAGERGPSLVKLAEATIRSVARGVLGTAMIQALLAGLGLVVAGVPAAGLLAFVCLILCTVQIGPGLVLVPAMIYLFWNAETTTAILFTAWSIPVMLIDNVLKPLLMRSSVDVPTVIILIGVIGGLLAYGLIGVFLGPVIIALGYELFRAWVRGEQTVLRQTTA